MKKRTLLLLAVSFALLICAVFGISALAANEATEESSQVGETAVSLSSDELIPEIVSKNVSYASNLHLYYAVPVSTVAEGSEISMDFFMNDPSASVSDYTVTEYEVQTISAITGKSEKYYVFRSYGFAAKIVGDEIWAVPVATDSEGNETRGSAVKYSIAEYCYERLYKAGYITKTKDDGKDYFRRDLYLGVLEYAAAAQQLFYIDKGYDVELVTDYAYYALNCVVNGEPNGFANEGDTIGITYDGTVRAGREMDGWKITSYADGKISVRVESSMSFILTVPAGGCVVEPLYIITDPIAVQEEEDGKLIASEWSELEAAAVAKYGEESGMAIVEAFKTLYTLYSDDMVDWAASLYSRGFNDLESGNWAGGYYASTVGRDTVGYGPDVQCTAQMISFINGSGMVNHLGDDYNVPASKYIPEWMQYEMVYFAKSLQDTSNGYFYHPQWGKETTDAHLSRRGRDLGWATSIIKQFGELPEVAAPNGTAGNGESANAYLHRLIETGKVDISEAPDSYFTWLAEQEAKASAAYATDAISSSVVMAVSKVMLAADTDESVSDTTNPEDEEVDSSTAYLHTHLGFIDYLLVTAGPNLDINPYSMGNTLNATYSQIANASATLGAYTYTAGDDNSCTDSAKVLAQFEGKNLAEIYQMFNGLTLKEMTIKLLTYKIHPVTGFWGTTWVETAMADFKAEYPAYASYTEKELLNVDEYVKFARPYGAKFANTNGFFKIITLYNSWGYVYPYPQLAAEGVMAGLLGDEIPSGNICCIYNLWSAVDSIQGNVSKTGGLWYKFNSAGEYYSEEYTAASRDAVLGYIDGVLAKDGAEAILNTYRKNIDYCKVDGGKGHNYYAGTGQHQGLPVTPSGYNLSDVDATCIGTTGLVREIYDSFNLAAYKVPIFTESDWMRYVNILETSEPVRKGDPAKAKYTFSDAEIPEDVSVFAGTVTMTEFDGSNALVLEKKLGATMIIDRHDVANRGEILSFEANLAFAVAGDYTLNFKTTSGIAASYIIRAAANEVTVIDAVSGTSYSVSCALGSSFKLKLEVNADLDETDTYHTVANVHLNGNWCGVITNFTEAEGYESITRVIDIKTAEIVETTAGAVYVDDLSFVIGAVGEYNVVFDNLEGGDWGKYRSLPGINIGTAKQSAEFTLEVEGDESNKYLVFDKTSSSSSNGMAWMVIENSKILDPGSDVWFETKMSFSEVQGSNSCIRLYDGRTAANGNNGTALTSKETPVTEIRFEVESSRVKMNGKDTGVAPGVWFTLRIVVSGNTANIYIVSDSGATTSFGSITHDNMSSIDAVQYTFYSNNVATFRFDDIYFGGDPSKASTENDTAIPSPAPSITDDGKCDEHNVATREESRTEPTCTVAGSYVEVSFCLTCGEELSREEKTIPAKGHTGGAAVVENNKAPTCTAQGSYDSVVYCTVCKVEISRNTVSVPKTAHTSGATVVENNKAPTCTAEGSYDNVVYCTVCNTEMSRNTVSVPKTGHTSGTAVVENNKAPTCTTQGSYDNVVYCTVCNVELSRNTVTVAATGHTSGAAVVENEVSATCTAEGSYDSVVYCTVCKVELSRDTVTTDKLNHVFAGGYEGVCSLCGIDYGLSSSGAEDFEEIAEGTWTAPGSGEVLIGAAKQSYAIMDTSVVVSDGATKYLSFNKSGRTDETQSNAMAWIVFQKNVEVDESEDIWFETRMRYDLTKGNTSHIRLYNGRTASSPSSGGTEITQSGTRLNTSAYGVQEGEWFTLRLVFSGTTVVGYVVENDGTLRQIYTLTNDSMESISSVQFTCQAGDYAAFDFEYVYFGGEMEYKEIVDLKPEGATDFDDKAEGAFTFDSAAGDSVLVNHYIQSGATATTTIVAEGDNKYFSMDKTAYSLNSSGTAASSQTWVLFERDASATGDEPLVFMTRMRYTDSKTVSNYFRFYDGRTAGNANDGTAYAGAGNAGRNINFRSSGGYVTFNDESIGVKVGEWFTLRLTIDGYTVKAESINDYGVVIKTVEVDKSQKWLEGLDLSDCDCVVIMNDSSAILGMDFDWVYFGKVPADKAE